MKKTMRRLPLLLALLAALAATGWSANGSSTSYVKDAVLVARPDPWGEYSTDSLIVVLDSAMLEANGDFAFESLQLCNSSTDRCVDADHATQLAPYVYFVGPSTIDFYSWHTFYLQLVNPRWGNFALSDITREDSLSPRYVVPESPSFAAGGKSSIVVSAVTGALPTLHAVAEPMGDNVNSLSGTEIQRCAAGTCPGNAIGASATCGYGKPCSVQFTGLDSATVYRVSAVISDGSGDIVPDLEVYESFVATSGSQLGSDATWKPRVNAVNAANVFATFNFKKSVNYYWFLFDANDNAPAALLGRQAGYHQNSYDISFEMRSTGTMVNEAREVPELFEYGTPSDSTNIAESSWLLAGHEYALYVLAVDKTADDEHRGLWELLPTVRFRIPGTPVAPVVAAVSDTTFVDSLTLKLSGSGKLRWSLYSDAGYNDGIGGEDGSFYSCLNEIRYGDEEGVCAELANNEIALASGSTTRKIALDGNTDCSYPDRESPCHLVAVAYDGEDHPAEVIHRQFLFFDNLNSQMGIWFEGERTDGALDSFYSWTTDSTLAAKSLKRGEGMPLSLEPGAKPYKIYITRGGSNPVLTWTVNVPARPTIGEEDKIRLPENDAQLVLMDYDHLWPVEFLPEELARQQICSEMQGQPGPQQDVGWSDFDEMCRPMTWGNDRYMLLSAETPKIWYQLPARENAFASVADTLRFDTAGVVFRPHADVSGEAVRLRMFDNFDGESELAYMRVQASGVALSADSLSRKTAYYYPELAPDEYAVRASLLVPVDGREITEYDDTVMVEDRPMFRLGAVEKTVVVEDLYHAVWAADPDVSNWEMAGLGASVNDLGPLADEQLLRWYESSAWDNVWAKYRAPVSVPAGAGVWLWVDSTVSFARERVSSPVEVDLDGDGYGWNQLANPYAVGISSDLLPDVPVYLWDRESADYVELKPGEPIPPFAAFWLQSVEEFQTIELRREPVFAADVPQAAPAPAPENLARVTLKAGRWSDANNYVGVGDPERSVGELPLAMGEGVSLTSQRDGAGFKNDVRAPDDVIKWSFALSSRVSGLARGTLSLENVAALSSQGYKLWIARDGKLTRVGEGSEVEVALPASGSRVDLYAARSVDDVERAVSESSSWKVTARRANDRGVRFSFTLDEPADLELRLLDVSGRPIASRSASFGAGAQQWEWSRTAPLPGAVFWSIQGGRYRAEGSF